MNKLRRFMARTWRPALICLVGIAAMAGLLSYRLGTLVKPFSSQELQTRDSSLSLRQIAENPVNAPHKVGQHIVQRTGFKGPAAMRAVSVFFGIIVICLFFLTAQIWFTPRIAAIGSLLFASSSWFLHAARSGSGEIMLALLLALIVCGYWLRYSNHRSWVIIFCSSVAALCLYIPGLVWFVTIFVLWQLKIIIREMRRIRWQFILSSALSFILFITPLIIAIIRRPEILRHLIGLPVSSFAWSDFGDNLLAIPVQLFVHGPDMPHFWLGRSPILDVFCAAMLILGFYRLFYQRKLDRTRLIGVVLIIGSLLIALGGFITITMILPVMYIIITSGITMMLQQWFTVFPRNPFARNIGVGLLTLAVLIAMTYQIGRYFIAWPRSPETRAVYNLSPQ